MRYRELCQFGRVGKRGPPLLIARFNTTTLQHIAVTVSPSRLSEALRKLKPSWGTALRCSEKFPHGWCRGGISGQLSHAEAFERQAQNALMLIESDGLVATLGQWADDYRRLRGLHRK